MPFANAAKRAGTFKFVPITVQPRVDAHPSFERYERTSLPDSAALPASASPMPSRIERFPRCITSRGIARGFTATTKRATSAVRDESEAIGGRSEAGGSG